MLINGLDMMSLAEYICTLNLMSYANASFNSFGMSDFDENGNRPWGVCYKVSEYQFGVLAGDSLDPRIYRGENKEYEHFTPSAKRLSYTEIDGIKKENFFSLYRETPYYQFGKTCTVPFGYHLEIDLEAVAQHYGFKTNYLDITRSRDVAEFFAYTYCDNGKYHPITDFSEYCPCIYTADLCDVYDQAPQSVKLISGQIAYRPCFQFAMAVDAADIFDYKTLFKKEILPKDPARSLDIYKKYYRKLFPDNDILGKISEEILAISEMERNAGLKIMIDEKRMVDIQVTHQDRGSSTVVSLDQEIVDIMKKDVQTFFEPLIQSTSFRGISRERSC